MKLEAQRVSVFVPAPRFNSTIETVFPFASKVQFVKVKVAPVVVKLSCKVHPPPDPLNVSEFARAIPFVVIVFPVLVARIVIAPL